MNNNHGTQTEEERKQTSQNLARYLIIIAVIEFVLIGAVVGAYFYAAHQGRDIPFELLLMGIGAFSVLAIVPIVFLAGRAGRAES